jgi:NADH-quinone oxidoreductase subunit A
LGGSLHDDGVFPDPAGDRRRAGGRFGRLGGHFTGPKNWTREKLKPYECGSESTGTAGVQLSAKFFITAILLVVFDVEVAFLYPWAALFRELGMRGLVAMFAFLGVLGIALLYLVRKGALRWEE